MDWLKFRRLLEELWDEETAYPASLKTGKQCKGRGQCYVTSLVIKRLFGGEVIRGHIGDEIHYWNKVDGVEVDLTSDQYGGDGINPVATGKPTTKLNWNNHRFKRLWKKVSNRKV